MLLPIYVQAQTQTAAQVEETVAGNPLPEHALRRPIAAFEGQVGITGADAAI